MAQRVVLLAWLFSIVFISSLLTPHRARAGEIAFKDDQLFVDGVAQPQLFGAEVQYFRLRGGNERNIPRETVIALWNQALDRLVEAKANAISFYIPWDFHEYAPGKFDFDGTVDEDGDGKPDYPSRDLKTWFQLVEAHGIHHIMVRPGPYINAEWGFLGFGAVPLWFHERFPNSHMQNANGQRTFLYGYSDADFLRESRIWLETLYREVLREHIGPGKPIDFVQVDNETNFQWQSIYNVDYSPRATVDYLAFLQGKYDDLGALNRAHGRNWASWAEVRAPSAPGQNLAEDQDWYRFQDQTIHIYLQKIRGIWENLGVREPHVLFTLAESYNAAGHGLLPNYLLRNDPGKTGLMTVNLYPKTSGSMTDSLLNQPFKADHDVKAATTANAHYHGHLVEWAMGPEIQGGWWRGTEVSAESRQQTYLSTIGHGLKALFVYYFNEGNNWEHDWAKNQIQPYYDTLKAKPEYMHLALTELPDQFWSELNRVFADQVLAGWDVRWIFTSGGVQSETLYFDAPLDGQAQARPPFQVLKNIGERVVAPYGQFLGSAVELTDAVCLLKDQENNVPSMIKGLDSTMMNSDWAGGLLAYFLHTGINPKILHWGLSSQVELDSCRVFALQDNGINAPEMLDYLRARVNAGKTVISFIGHEIEHALVREASCETLAAPGLNLRGQHCSVGAGYVYQVDSAFYKDFNSENYARLTDIAARRVFLESILAEAQLKPQIHIAEGADRLVAFARQSAATVATAAKKASRRKIWITVKSGRITPTEVHVQWSTAEANRQYRVTDVMAKTVQTLSGRELRLTGFVASLAANGSSAYFIEPIAKRRAAF